MPRYFFHHKETFFPTHVEQFVDHATLYYQHHAYAPYCEFVTHSEYGFPLPVLTVSHDGVQYCMDAVERGVTKLRGDCNLKSIQCELQNNTRHNVIQCSSASARVDQMFFLHVGRALDAPFNASAPVYTHVSKNDYHPDFPADAFVVQYWSFYVFNGALDDMLMAGAHEGDWEHVTVVVSADERELLGVYMAAHSHEGQWLKPGAFVQTGHAVHVYVALHTHASYPSQGVKKRINDNVMYSFLHDHCSNDGVVWHPDTVINMGEQAVPLVPWAYYNGYWGSKKLGYSFIPLPFDSASPPRGPMHQADYWYFN
jgi:hypothetical protein